MHHMSHPENHLSTSPISVCLLPSTAGQLQWLQSEADGLGKIYALTGCQSDLSSLAEVTSLDFPAADLAAYLAVIESQNPESVILLVAEDIELPEFWLPRMQAVMAAAESNAVVTSLGNAKPKLNPLAADESPNKYTDQRVYLAANGNWFIDNQWPTTLALLQTEASNSLIKYQASTANAVDILQLEQLQVAVCGNLYSRSTSMRAANPLPVLGQICQKVSNWPPTTGAAMPGLDGKPVLLHITHSWGGGIDRWINDFCQTDTSHHHLILQARTVTKDLQENLKLSLWANGKRQQISTWCLQPEITASAIEHPQYREILRQINLNFAVDQIIIASLIGHSLDVLRTELPCLQLIHDYYPLWPFLTEDPTRYTDVAGHFDFQQAWETLQNQPEASLPGNHSLTYWNQLQQQYMSLLDSTGVIQVAPSNAAAAISRLLNPGRVADIQVIAHGIETTNLSPLPPPQRQSEKLRLLVPGRIHPGKGKRLLLNALPELSKLADVYLLGSGKDGEDFFGISGVHVSCQYQVEDLADEAALIAADAALLLSTVPETWSYTLSEMTALGIPVIATKIGAFTERLEALESGWLIDTDSESLIQQVQKLAEKPELLEQARAKLQAKEVHDLEAMVAAYSQLLVNQPGNQPPGVSKISVAILQTDMVNLQKTRLQENLTAQATKIAQQTRELQARADWVCGVEAEIQQTQVASENAALTAGKEIERVNNALIERTEWAQSEINKLAEESQSWEALHQQKADSLQQVLASSSWKLTKPLRTLTRFGRNLQEMQAWNPKRWPYIFKRLRQSLAIRGLNGTLQRAQNHKQPSAAPKTALKPIEILKQRLDIHSNPVINQHKFTAVEKPLVSIIIPLFNQYLYTQACLESINKVSNTSSFEIILVDDCSTDKTTELLAACTGVTQLRNLENLGFIGSCNRGAEAATGEYLLFLNNDTQVTDNWLDTLLATFQEFPNAGVVGSRLIYPDGSLQEAGGIIFKDASGWNYGRYAKANDPRYLFVREVDYVSGAALMVRAEMFKQLGGFDNHYAPAYYEDTDLAFKCRKAGYQVLVQPCSTVIHHEGISSGTDLSQGMKKYQLVNHKKFQQRWSKELKLQPDPIADPEDTATVRAAAEHYCTKKILIIDATTPHPDQDSGSVRIINIMRIFRDLGYQVTFFSDNRQWDGNYSEALQAMGIEVLFGEWLKNLPEFFIQRGSQFDAVMISRHYVAENYLKLIEKHMPHAEFIFDTVDLHYLREQRQAELEEDPRLHRAAARSRRAELKIINLADTTLVVSPYEKSVLEHDAPDARVDIVSNVHPVHGCRRPFSERKNIFFIGGYQHPPNVDAAIWLAKHIWPLIHAQLPGVQCFLIGSKAPPIVQKLGGDGLVYKGFVNDLEPWLDNYRIAVAPLRFGAGVKGKVNMSMSYGQPVVATGIAVEGMHAQNGREVLVADSAEDFAAEVVRLYQDEALWQKLSENGLKNVTEHFSFEAARRNILEMMASL